MTALRFRESRVAARAASGDQGEVVVWGTGGTFDPAVKWGVDVNGQAVGFGPTRAAALQQASTRVQGWYLALLDLLREDAKEDERGDVP